MRQRLERYRFSQLPLRARLTLWYLLTLAAILVLFLTFLYWQVQRNLLAQMDAALQLAATQALATVERQGDELAFERGDAAGEAGTLNPAVAEDLAIYLLSPVGTVWDWQGEPGELAAQAPRAGFRTVNFQGDAWRVYSERIPAGGINAPSEGWIQVAQEMDPVTDTLLSLRAQMLLGLPLALLLAGLGGFFLAWRALQPIERITQTAETITAGDLSRRIDYEGPPDEVGRLAATFDSMLARLQAAFARERRFTGDAAHELRTPLTAMKGRIEVTLIRPRSPEAYAETLEEMGDQVDRLIRLSSDLLFMARLDQADGQAARREPVALPELLPALLDQVQPLAARKEIALHSDLAPDLTVRGDLDLLIRLFLNLLDNAIKYTPPGGTVTVTARPAANGATVTIHDTGIGIPTEHLPHLFQRFYRVDTHRTRLQGEDGHGGAGLGLAIVGEIVRVHGGRVEVESEVGVGTCVEVWLPDA